jgi:hypothetical protein
MAQPDPLNLAHGHLAVAARCALDFHKAITLAYRAEGAAPRARADLSLIALKHNIQMRHLALLMNDLSPFFADNLAASLNAAADNWRA